MNKVKLCIDCKYRVSDYPLEDKCSKWDDTGYNTVIDEFTGKKRREPKYDGLSTLFRPRISTMRGTGVSFSSPKGYTLPLCGPNAHYWTPAPTMWETIKKYYKFCMKSLNRRLFK